MQMRIDDVANARSGALDRDGIDDPACGMPGASEQVGNGNGIRVQVLAENHGTPWGLTSA